MTMDDAQDAFRRANALFRRRDYQRWQQHQSKQQILRSQVGFADTTPSRPKVCEGCMHYHGVAYGTSRERRSKLICGFHPMGWMSDRPCPDWQGAEASL